LPCSILLWRHTAVDWCHPAFAGTGVLSVVLILYWIDCLFNAMINPVFILAAGGLSGLVAKRPLSPGQASRTRGADPLARLSRRPSVPNVAGVRPSCSGKRP